MSETGSTRPVEPQDAVAAGVRTAIGSQPVPAVDAGWSRLAHAIRTEHTPPRVANDNRLRFWRAAAAALALLFVGQTAWVAVAPDDRARLASVERDAAPGNVVVVAFRPDASEAAIRATLRENGARIVDGPSALGLYRVRVSAEKADALSRSAAVESLSEG